jgi:hypothetical protein
VNLSHEAKLISSRAFVHTAFDWWTPFYFCSIPSSKSPSTAKNQQPSWFTGSKKKLKADIAGDDTLEQFLSNAIW